MSIVTPEFVKFYNFTFNFINDECGYLGLESFWKEASNILLLDLKVAVKQHGLRGAYDYWKKIFTAECVKGQISYYPNKSKLVLEIDACPSCRILGDSKFKFYCDHCFIMYQPIFKEAGYSYKLETKGTESCQITIEKL